VGTHRKSSASAALREQLRAEAGRYVDAEKVPFRLLHRVCEALRDEDGGGEGPWLQDLVRGESGGVALEAPRRPPRDPELEARCRRLRDDLEQREYDEMTRDVRGKRGDEGLKMSTLTRELGFGAHVVTVMAACFAGGMVTGEACLFFFWLFGFLAFWLFGFFFWSRRLPSACLVFLAGRIFFFSGAADRARTPRIARASRTLPVGRSVAPDSQTVQVVLGMAGCFVALMVEALLFIARDGKT
jgi:hypothetical protein